MTNSNTIRWALILAGLSAAELPVAQLAEASPAFALQRHVEATPQSVDPSTIPARWERAEQLHSSGQLAEAVREYSEIAKIQREHGLDASDTFWMIAEIRNAQGDYLAAARALDNVQREASTFGHFDLRARAMLESAFLYNAANQPAKARDRVQLLRALLESPYVSASVRDELIAQLPQ